MCFKLFVFLDLGPDPNQIKMFHEQLELRDFFFGKEEKERFTKVKIKHEFLNTKTHNTPISELLFQTPHFGCVYPSLQCMSVHHTSLFHHVDNSRGLINEVVYGKAELLQAVYHTI